MSDSYKKIGSSSQTLLQKIAERHAIYEKEEAERIAREKAEFDALPEEEKHQIIVARELERQEQQRRITEQEREEQIQKFKRRGIPPRFYDETWDTWKADTPEKKEAKEKIRQAWKKNLFIIGENGTGKTHLAMCLVKEGATYCKTAELFRSV
jgi:DNA replication protein DnaC